jgi:hypothetical protein
MKLFIEQSGGPSPGLTFHAKREDIKIIASSLLKSVEQMEKENRKEKMITPRDLEIRGKMCDWISFSANENTEDLIEEFEQSGKYSLAYAIFGAGLMLAVFYFTIIGVISTFT